MEEEQICPNVTDLLLNEPIGTPVGQEIGTYISAIGLSYATIVFGLFTARRHISPAKEHSYLVVALQYIGLILCFCAGPLNDAVGRSVYPCSLLFVSRISWLLINQGPLTGMVFIVYSQLLLQSRMRSIKKYTPEAMLDKVLLQGIADERATIRTLKMRYGYRGAIAFGFLVFFTGVILFLIYIPRKEMWVGCQGCKMQQVDTVVLGVLGTFFVALMGYVNYFAYKKELGDNAFIIRESWQATSTWFATVIIFFPCWLLDIGNLNADGYFNWFNLVAINCCFAFSLNNLQPVIRTFRKAAEVDITLSDILSTAEGEELFEEHLQREFSVEHFRFYNDARRWCQDYADPALDSKSENGNIQRHARWLYDTYISETAVLEINVSDKTGTKIKAAFDEPIVQADVFDEAIKEVYNLMERDSLSRFIHSPKGRNYVKRMQFQNASRPIFKSKSKHSKQEFSKSDMSLGNSVDSSFRSL